MTGNQAWSAIDHIKKIKLYLLAKEADNQANPDTVPLSWDDHNDRLQTIKDIGPTMHEVIDYCYIDGWNTMMVAELMLKVVFGESWDDDWKDWT